MRYQVINERKRALNLTNAQLAEKTGVTLSTLDKITSGANDNPKLSTLQAIARVIGCTLDDFDDQASGAAGFSLTLSEREHVRLYRELDAYGREMVDSALAIEHRRCAEHSALAALAARQQAAIEEARAGITDANEA